MKSAFIGNLVPNEVVTAQFLVLSKEIRQKKTGEPYLTLHLADRTGEIEARMWDNVAEVMNTFERDHFIKVKGLPQVYQNRSQFVIHRLRRLEDHEVDFSDYFPCSERDPAEMFAELRALIAGMQNPHLRALLQSVFNDGEIARLYCLAPAAKNIHHACRGGLLEHVLSLCALGRFTAAHYSEIDGELLLTGIILHDIGKIEELLYARSFGYSAEGQLLGHIVLGLRLLNAKFEAIPDFPPKLRTLIEHMIISHHGELEFGSPKVPIFSEALLLHHLDNLDSKMNAVRNALRRDRLAQGEFTGWIASLERVLLRKDEYLSDKPVNESALPADEPEKPAAAETITQPEPPVPETPMSELPAPEVPAAARAVVKEAPAPPSQPALPLAPRAFPQHPIAEHRRPESHLPAATNTLFGEKLQAVLNSRK
jgi:3'-5' exoribonuclease